MKNMSRSSMLATGAFVATAASLLGPFAHKVSAFLNTGCVAETRCLETPPPGKYCDNVNNVDGSEQQDNGVAATSDSCSYVDYGSNPGTACGSAVPDAGGPGCN